MTQAEAKASADEIRNREVSEVYGGSFIAWLMSDRPRELYGSLDIPGVARDNKNVAGPHATA